MPEPAAKILVADDDQSLVRTLSWILKENGYDVITAPGGEGLFGKLEEERPNLLLLDIMMPKVDGLQLLARMKSDDLFHASRRGDGQGAGPGRGGLHLQAVPGAGAAGARQGAHPLGPGAGAGARRSAEPCGHRRHPARSHRLAQAGRDLSHPRPARGARAP